jgi:hypothetical protein
MLNPQTEVSVFKTGMICDIGLLHCIRECLKHFHSLNYSVHKSVWKSVTCVFFYVIPPIFVKTLAVCDIDIVMHGVILVLVQYARILQTKNLLC